MNQPDNLPPLPPAPPGFDRWEYRGTRWKSPTVCRYAFAWEPCEEWLYPFPPDHGSIGYDGCHYIEAMREPAKPTPKACGDACRNAKIDSIVRPHDSCDIEDGICDDPDEPAKDQPASGNTARNTINEEMPVKLWVIIEAARAFRTIRKDPNSYYAKVFSDDAANIKAASEELERILAAMKPTK